MLINPLGTINLEMKIGSDNPCSRHLSESQCPVRAVHCGVGNVRIALTSSEADKGWAVSDPELKAVERSTDGRITRYRFGMRLYCSVGSGLQQSYGCAVNVQVCYKP
jgi:hypothetical protein